MAVSSSARLEVSEGVHAVTVVRRDPALGDLVDGCRVEVVELLPPAANGRDEVGRLEHREVLAHRLPGHVQPGAELAQGLAVAGRSGCRAAAGDSGRQAP